MSLLWKTWYRLNHWNRPNELIYITLTTIPERLQSDYFRQALESLIYQYPTKIILNVPWIYKRTGESYVIPDWIAQHPDVIVHRCEDQGPVTKVLGGLSLIPDDAWVIVVDDDHIYKDFLVSELALKFSQRPEGVLCFCTFEEPKWVEMGHEWAARMPCGFAGWIAKATDVKRLQSVPLPKECRLIDDHWLGWAFHVLQKPVRRISDDYKWYHSIKHKDHGADLHPPWFELRAKTNRRRLQRECMASIQQLHMPGVITCTRGYVSHPMNQPSSKTFECTNADHLANSPRQSNESDALRQTNHQN